MDAYCDGARRGSHSAPGHCSCAFAVFNIGEVVAQGGRYLGSGSNNFAEFSGLLDLLKWAENNEVKGLSIFSDSQLIVKQTNGEWQVKQDALRPLRDLAYALLIRGGHTLGWVRGHSGNPGNELCDKLCNDVLDKELL